MRIPDDAEKFTTVIEQNTYYFRDIDAEEANEARISSIAQGLFILKNKIDTFGLTESVLCDYITQFECGLEGLLTITGLSKESFQRLVSFIRLSDNEALAKLVNKDSWPKGEFSSEWQLEKIKELVQSSPEFAAGIVNLFMKGSTLTVIRELLPLFEYKKLDIKKLSFSTESLVDTIIRYKTKGSFAASRVGNPETLIESILIDKGISFERGTISVGQGIHIPRTMDFIIPSKASPRMFVECSYVITTSSGMGDKAKTEQAVRRYLDIYLPSSVFVGFIDGIGWFVRRGDLMRMVRAYHYVFTFRQPQIKRFIDLLEEVVGDQGE